MIVLQIYLRYIDNKKVRVGNKVWSNTFSLSKHFHSSLNEQNFLLAAISYLKILSLLLVTVLHCYLISHRCAIRVLALCPSMQEHMITKCDPKFCRELQK
jgi:hypothetical protein